MHHGPAVLQRGAGSGRASGTCGPRRHAARHGHVPRPDAPGWHEVALATPVPVTGGTRPTSRPSTRPTVYGYTDNFFARGRTTPRRCTRPASGNGVFVYGRRRLPHYAQRQRGQLLRRRGVRAGTTTRRPRHRGLAGRRRDRRRSRHRGDGHVRRAARPVERQRQHRSSFAMARAPPSRPRSPTRATRTATLSPQTPDARSPTRPIVKAARRRARHVRQRARAGPRWSFTTAAGPPAAVAPTRALAPAARLRPGGGGTGRPARRRGRAETPAPSV